MSQFIITAVGPDRPGLVGELTAHLHAAGANLLDSRMVNLRGQFAMMILLDAPPSANLQNDLPRLGKTIGLTLTVTEQKPTSPAKPGLKFQLKTYSFDQPGIVARLSSILREHAVNIEDLTTRQESAPFDGGTLFLTNMRITVPSGVPINDLRQKLTAVCNQLNCDLDFEPETR
jgi:glycine cleavage system transcriptional repressor